MGFVAVTLAAVNIFGGFIVTQRMLQMFQKNDSGGRRDEREPLRASCIWSPRSASSWRCAACRSPETARAGNIYGIAGMVDRHRHDAGDAAGRSAIWLIILGIMIGGAVGTYIALQHPDDRVAAAGGGVPQPGRPRRGVRRRRRVRRPEAYGIGVRGAIHARSLVEMALGVAIGAITFTGSIVAFGKLQGLVSGAPLVFPGSTWSTPALGVLLILLIVAVRARPKSAAAFCAAVLLSLALGFLLILPIGGADMPVVISMLNSYSGWAAAASASRCQQRC